MKRQPELEWVRKYIDNFHPEEFTSPADLDFGNSNEERLQVAKKIKGRIKRRKMMAESFAGSLRQERACQVMITQEQIDQLLTGFS